MLEMRPCCEWCGKDLPAHQAGALMCSFECTFCSDCDETELKGTCPNCGGGLVERPTRSLSLLEKYPASKKRIVRKQ